MPFGDLSQCPPLKLDDGFIAVTDETAPTVERFDAKGERIEAVPMPAPISPTASPRSSSADGS
ncbi:hypothetical protein [Polyangium mundeleinium]|uniref:Uncharacterized protein n=1 Tax=Polyangium mundeleinium TaxID=2995306 RepID=A0ABT5EX92_9BACT|nr:hypothetical protein [Polyangium mundeleinium]MDC0746436.1 hypothetical protein [Polyangium mundeleinium]